jgi:hypothetical protein
VQNNKNDEAEKLKVKMLKSEEKLISALPDYSLEYLLELLYNVQAQILERPEIVRNTMYYNREYGTEALLSTFRIIKAILAEFEYRILEDKI